MPTINLTPPNVTLTIGGRNWSRWYKTIEVGWDAIDITTGLATVRGTIVLSLGRDNNWPTDPNPASNPQAWDRGTSVSISVQGIGFLPCSGERLFILDRVQRPYGLQPELTITIGDELSLRSFAELNPTTNPTQIDYEPLPRSTIIRNILEAANITNINVAGIDGALDYPIEGSGEGLVAFAGKVAAAARTILYSRSDGTVIGLTLDRDLTPDGTPVSTKYVDLMPANQYSFIPVEEYLVETIVNDVLPIRAFSTTTNSYNTPFNLFGNGANDRLIVFRAETIQFNTTVQYSETITTTREILGLIAPAEYPESQNMADSGVVVERRYFNEDNTLSYTEATTQTPLFIIDFAAYGFDRNLVATEVIRESYNYDLNQQIVSSQRTRRLAEPLIFAIDSSSIGSLRDYEQIQVSWERVGTQWKRSETRYLVAGITEPEKSPFSFRLQVVDGTTVISRDAPPQATFREPEYSVERSPLRSIVTHAQPANDPNPRRTNIFIDYVSTQEELDEWAATEIALRYGRNRGWFVEVPIQSISLGQAVTITHRGVSYTFVADAVTYRLEDRRASVTFTGINIGETEPNELGVPISYGLPPVTILDVGKPRVTIEISRSAITEGDLTPIVVTVRASKPVQGEQAVELYFTGDASQFNEPIPPVLRIPNGASTATLSLTVVNNFVIEQAVQCNFRIDRPTFGLVLGSTTSVGLTINDDDVPIEVSITASPQIILEGQSQGVFTFTRSVVTPFALSISYEVSGSASPEDYTPQLTGTIVIPGNQRAATIEILATEDLVTDPLETLILRILPSADYLIGANGSATITIEEVVPADYSGAIVPTVTATASAPLSRYISSQPFTPTGVFPSPAYPAPRPSHFDLLIGQTTTITLPSPIGTLLGTPIVDTVFFAIRFVGAPTAVVWQAASGTTLVWENGAAPSLNGSALIRFFHLPGSNIWRGQLILATLDPIDYSGAIVPTVTATATPPPTNYSGTIIPTVTATATASIRTPIDYSGAIVPTVTATATPPPTNYSGTIIPTVTATATPPPTNYSGAIIPTVTVTATATVAPTTVDTIGGDIILEVNSGDLVLSSDIDTIGGDIILEVNSEV